MSRAKSGSDVSYDLAIYDPIVIVCCGIVKKLGPKYTEKLKKKKRMKQIKKGARGANVKLST
jgi:hypothetical protein